MYGAAPIDRLMGTEHVLYVVGAYGREANTKDWMDGKDFKIVNGPYCSKRDTNQMHKDGWEHVVLLDNHGHEVCNIALGPDGDVIELR